MPAKRYIRKLIKLGSASLAVTLPADVTKKLRWREKQKVVVVPRGRHLAIKDWKP